MSSQQVADRLLEKAGVALLSGSCFGKFGEGYLRLSFANSQENIAKAIQKISAFFGKI
jgi:aspartate/methionine/tyrosine aminotransferase